jgi:hypothetical protein
MSDERPNTSRAIVRETCQGGQEEIRVSGASQQAGWEQYSTTHTQQGRGTKHTSPHTRTPT